MADACAAIVARDDPRLHATALFAPRPARAALMALYAFDVELDRAVRASAERMIALLRLQWWRDAAEAAHAGRPPPAHAVAGPFARLVVERRLPAASIEAMIAAREAELEGGFDAAGFAAWADGRFGARTALAARLLGGGDDTVALARRAGPVLGAAFVLRHAGAMAPEGRIMLPGLVPEDRAALATGALTAHAREAVGRFSADALTELAALRRDRARIDRRATPAFLPLVRAGRVLGRAARVASGGGGGDGPAPRSFPRGGEGEGGPAPDPSPRRGEGVDGGRSRLSERPSVGLGEIDAIRPFEGVRLAVAAATGRW